MFKALLAAEFAPFCALSEVQLEQLDRHYQSLTRWNDRLNLTRIRDLDDCVRFHYCESLFLGRFLPPGSHRVVDIGSGGGFPGIPIAILRPECEVTLVESHQRKAVFLREATRDLRNVRVVSRRGEDVHDAFDWLVSRAVAPEEVLRLNLSPRIALLIGSEDAEKLAGETEPIPWGARRVLFHVEREVSSHA
jgi:16S rRNA (guanine(527)-N(7))-methyltransferase RsmG